MNRTARPSKNHTSDAETLSTLSTLSLRSLRSRVASRPLYMGLPAALRVGEMRATLLLARCIRSAAA